MPKVWFVTGSSRGLGKSIVEFALNNGDSVAATARNSAALSHFVDKYGSDKVLTLSLDVTSWEASSNAVQAAFDKFKRLDVVINNAGYANLASVEDLDIADFRQQIDTNLMGVVHVSKAVTPILRKQGSGHIFNISSVGGRIATAGLSAYQSAKWAVGGFTSILAAELAPHGVKVTALEPGAIRTDWAGSSMTIHPASEPYRQLIEPLAGYMRSTLGKEVSQPAKIAAMLETLYNAPEPPIRMLVGPDAVQFAAQAAEAQAKTDEKWKDLTLASA